MVRRTEETSEYEVCSGIKHIMSNEWDGLKLEEHHGCRRRNYSVQKTEATSLD